MGEMDFGNASGFSRREFLKRTGALGLGAALGASGLLSACSPGAGGDQPVNLTHFIWVGGGQGIVPREVKAEYERDHPNVSIELYEGTNATTYPKMVAQKEVDPNNPLINFGFFNKPLPKKCFCHWFESFVLPVEKVYFVIKTAQY